MRWVWGSLGSPFAVRFSWRRCVVVAAVREEVEEEEGGLREVKGLIMRWSLVVLSEAGVVLAVVGVRESGAVAVAIGAGAVLDLFADDAARF